MYKTAFRVQQLDDSHWGVVEVPVFPAAGKSRVHAVCAVPRKPDGKGLTVSTRDVANVTKTLNGLIQQVQGVRS